MQSSEWSEYSSPKGNSYIVNNLIVNHNGNSQSTIKGRRIITENNVTFNTLDSDNSRRFPQQLHFVKKTSSQKQQYRLKSETIEYEDMQKDYSNMHRDYSNMQKDYSSQSQNINLLNTNINLQNKCYNLISPKSITIQNVKIQNSRKIDLQNRKIDLQNLKNQIDKNYQSLPTRKHNPAKKRMKTTDDFQKSLKIKKTKKQVSQDSTKGKIKIKKYHDQHYNSGKVVKTEMSENMKKLVNKSVNKSKIMKEEIKTEQRNKENEELQKKMNKEMLNKEIRKRNVDRFVHKKENSNFKKFPWNFDQQKLKEFYVNMFKQEERKVSRKQKQKVINDDMRRKNVGLDFLNSFNIKQITKMKQNQKLKEMQINQQIEAEKQSKLQKKQISQEEQEQIQLFIEFKKKQQQQQKYLNQLIVQEQQQRVKQNLQKVEEQAKYFRNVDTNQMIESIKQKQKEKERKIQRDTQREKKKSKQKEKKKGECKDKKKNEQKERKKSEQKERKKSEQKEKEKKKQQKITSIKINKSQGQQNTQTYNLFKNQKIDKIINSSNLTNNKLINQKEQKKERVDEVQQKIQGDQIDKLNINDTNLLQNIEEIDSQVYEMDELSRKISKKESKKQSSQDQQQQQKQEQEQQQQQQQQQWYQQQENQQKMLGENSNESPFVMKQPVSQMNQQQQSIEEVESGNQSLSSQALAENFELLHSIATTIQKVYRGYRTRKMLREYFEFIIQQQMNNEENEQMDSNIEHQQQQQMSNYETQNQFNYQNEIIMEDDNENIESVNQTQTQRKVIYDNNLQDNCDSGSDTNEQFKKDQIEKWDMICSKINELKVSNCQNPDIQNALLEIEEQSQKNKLELLSNIKNQQQNSQLNESIESQIIQQIQKYQMRKVIGSEQLLRVSQSMSNSYNTIENSNNYGNFISYQNISNNQDVFRQQPFQEFVFRFFMGMSNDSQALKQIIQQREQLIQQQQFNELSEIDNRYYSQQIDYDQYKRKRVQVEKWAVKQQKQIEQTKNKIQWILGLDNYIKTKRDIELFNKSQNDESFMDKKHQDNLICQEKLENQNQVAKQQENNKISLLSDHVLDHLINESLQVIAKKQNQHFKQDQISEPMINFGYKLDDIFQKPFDSSVMTINDYLRNLSFVIKELQSEHLITNINIPYDWNIQQKLSLYRNKKIQTIMPPQCIDGQLSQIVQQEYYSQQQEQMYFNQMIFDCMNEALEHFRPFDLRGSPLPWKINIKKLTYSDINENNLDLVLEQAKTKVLDWSLVQQGVLNSNQSQEYEFDVEEAEKIKDFNIQKNLINEIYENDDRWINYQEHETIIQMEIANFVAQYLVDDTVSLLQSLQQ